LQNNKYTNEYLSNIFKLLKRKDNKYFEKRFLVTTYEKIKKEEEKFYLTGMQFSKNKDNESTLLGRNKGKI